MINSTQTRKIDYTCVKSSSDTGLLYNFSIFQENYHVPLSFTFSHISLNQLEPVGTNDTQQYFLSTMNMKRSVPGQEEDSIPVTTQSVSSTIGKQRQINLSNAQKWDSNVVKSTYNS